ncbi:MAG: hypothetical protein Unbinned202contig1002_9 [Prokaryotic dsDNA virus sp.]|nr:MAG: hypothetical protein Unbinned202contig1002_9 [Prokaryotic dsDNA virus sp.]|tara:strand:+ start:261 stop:488 length:228 start_codon:yes stop_codon:yes gene_type:complete
MDFKSMLMEMAEAQADKMRDEAMKQISSDDFADMLATKLNEKIDIPFVSEEKEQEFFEKAMDLLTDVLAGFFKGK